MMTLDRPRPATLEAPAAPAAAPAPPRPRFLRAFAALVWKDLRPHLALIIIQWIFAATAALLLFYAAWFLAYLYQNVGFNILLYPPFLTIAGIYFPLCGLLLGFVHGLADGRLDAWALLTHRPIPRALHGPARITAGLLLYAAGAGLPYAILIFVAATRHAGAHGGFFAWPFVLPSLASFLLGIPCYLAAQLATCWHLPWKHAWAKALPLAVPAIAAVALYDLPAFFSVLLVLAIAAALLALTLTAAIATHAFRLTAPGWGRLALAIVLLTGSALPIAWLRSQLEYRLTYRISIFLHNHITPIHLPPESPLLYNPITFNDHYTLLPDGTIALQHTDPADPLALTDLQNHPIPAPKSWPISYRLSQFADRPPTNFGYRDIAQRVSLFQDHELVYHFNGTDYRYDPISHAYLGSQKSPPSLLDAFSPPSGERPQEVIFLGNGWPGIPNSAWNAELLSTNHTLYLITPRDHTILRQFPLDPPLATAPIDVVLLDNPARIVLWHRMDHEWIIADTFDPEGHFLHSTEAGAQRAREARLQEDAARAAAQEHRLQASTQPASLANAAIYQRAGAYVAFAAGALDALQGFIPTHVRSYLTNTPPSSTDSYPRNPSAYRLAWWLLTLPLLPLAFRLSRRRRLPASETLLYTLFPLLLGPLPFIPLLLMESPRSLSP
ncbi:MAG TPA: hypothetical protein VH253_19060 [Phycisphaerae bacterium]|nr:hypothetical protein [Phycisphaerae bacterium]